MTRLVVRLLGGFRVELDGEAVYDFESDKCRALLAFLIVEADRPHRRETLASLLWPDRPDSSARANLRQALSSLRRALGDQVPHGHGSPEPGARSLPVRHLHRCAVQLGQRLLARRSRAAGIRGRCLAFAVRCCPRRSAPISSPVSPCRTASRSRPGCWTGRSTTTGWPSKSLDEQNATFEAQRGFRRGGRGGAAAAPHGAVARRGAPALHAGPGPGRAPG